MKKLVDRAPEKELIQDDSKPAATLSVCEQPGTAQSQREDDGEPPKQNFLPKWSIKGLKAIRSILILTSDNCSQCRKSQASESWVYF